MSAGRDAVIVGAVRTPLGRRGGAYRGVHAVDLAAAALDALVRRTGVDPGLVEDVLLGCVSQVGEQGVNVARSAVLAAGWPESVPAASVDRQCGSGQQAVHFAAAGVVAGHYDLVVAGGVESMTRVPLGTSVSGPGGRPYGPSVAARYAGAPFHQGLAAEAVARRWGLSRRQLDELALSSHERAAAAIDAGRFAGQYAPVPGAGLAADEGVRRDTDLDRLAALPPVFDPAGVVTAGSSSQISDGAAALLLTTSEHARRLGLRPLARVHAVAVVGDDPVLMLAGPIPATRAVLRRAGLRLDEIGAYEVNEAFAPVPLAWLAETGAEAKLTNPLGGAIALGHPLGASGAVLVTRLVHHLADDGIRYGLVTMCEGGGLANAMVLERL